MVVAVALQFLYLVFARSVLAAWAKRGGRGRARVDAEPGRSPAALRYLLRRRFGEPDATASTGRVLALDLGLLGERDDDPVALTATVLDLAARGLVTIEAPATEEGPRSLDLLRVEGRDDNLLPEDAAVVGALFPRGGRYLQLRPGAREASAAKRELEDVLIRGLGGPIFALHRRWATLGYLISAVAALVSIQPLTATLGRWVVGLGLLLSIPSGLPLLNRALRETRRSSGEILPVRRWGAALGVFFDARTLSRSLAFCLGTLIVARVLDLQVILDRSHWTSHVGIGASALSLASLAIFATTFTIVKKHSRLALAVEFAMFLCWVLALGFGWWELDGPWTSAVALTVTGLLAYAIGPMVLRAPTEIDGALAAAVDERRAELAAASDLASQQHPFRTPSGLDRSLAYAVAMESPLPLRCPSWFEGDWEAVGGSVGLVRALSEALHA